MKWIAVVLVLFTSCACAARTHRVTIPVAMAADVVSTEYSIAQGNVELNPIFDTTGKRVAISVAYTALVVWFIDRLHEYGHHGWAKAFEITIVGYKGGLSAWNVKKAREAKEGSGLPR